MTQTKVILKGLVCKVDGGYAIVMLTSIDENGLMSYEKSSSKVLPRVKKSDKGQNRG